MARGQEAKNILGNKIIGMLGDSFITVKDKKIYCWMKENGEQVQIAISMTVPKNEVSADGTVQDSSSSTRKSAFEMTSTAIPVSNEPVEVTEEDSKKIDKILKELGVTD